MLVLTAGIITTNYANQLGALFAEGAAPNPGHALGEIEGGNDLATKTYVNDALSGISGSNWIVSGSNIYRSSGNVGIGTVSPTVKLDVVGVIRGTGVVTNRSGETRPTCNSSTEGMQWYDYNLKVLLLCNGTSWRYPSPLACGYNFTDPRDGNVYTTVQIGTQCWMAKNLAYLPSVVPSATGSETTPYYYVYGYNGTDVATAKAQANYATYGVLYNHPATVDACPTGWRMPTHDDWTDLERAICTSETCLADFPKNTTTTGWRGTDEGTKLKSGGSSNFEALMSGLRDTDGSFYSVGSGTTFWSSSEGGTGAWRRNLRTSYSTVSRNTPSKAYGFSVRCLKN